MKTQKWTLVIYTNEWDWRADDNRNAWANEYHNSKQEAEHAAKVAEYQGYWVSIFNPEGELT